MDTTILKAAPTQSPANVALPPSPLPSVPVSKPAALSLNKPKLDNLAGDIWKSAERLRGKFKAYEYQGVILPIIVIRRLVGIELLDHIIFKRQRALRKRLNHAQSPP